MQTTNEYVPTKGDLCYVITEKSSYGDAHRSFGAIVRIDKVRINHYRGNRSHLVSSVTIEVSGVEGYRGGVNESNWRADYSSQLLPIHMATPKQKQKFAAARDKRAVAEAKVRTEQQYAETFEAEFKAKHMDEVNAPTTYGDVIENKQNKDRYTFTCVREYKRFRGHGRDVTIESCEDAIGVSLRWEQDRFTLDEDKGQWRFEFSGYCSMSADAMDAHLRCVMAAQAKLAELNQAQLVAA